MSPELENLFTAGAAGTALAEKLLGTVGLSDALSVLELEHLLDPNDAM